jgi:ribosome-associated heat shock protein Hsp15
MEKVRIDKWLWAVRIYKTRSMAAEACSSGKVKIDGKSIKPAKEISEGMIIELYKDMMHRKFKVLQLLEKRVAAKLVAEYMEDLTPESEFVNRESVMSSAFYRKKGLGRPTKKERREIDRLKG